MSCGGTARRLVLVAALPLSAVACGESGGSLPAATSLTPSISVSIASTDTAAPGDSVTIAPATAVGTVTTDIKATTTAPPTTAPAVTGPWVNATDGIVGLSSECGNLSTVAVRPDRDMLVASIAQQGLWSSTSGADVWSILGGGPGSARITNRGATIIFDPTNLETFWESGIYNGGGVYRTDDNGLTFHQLGTITHVEGLSVDFSDPDRRTMLATIHESQQTLRSSDGGETWTDITSALPSDLGFATGPVVIDAQTFLIGTSHGTGSSLLRSTDAGATWTTVYDAGVIGSPLRAQLDGTIYWLLERINGTITSVDNGQTWTLITPKSETLPTFPLLELQDGSLASISQDKVIISTDHGASWTSVGPSIPITPTGIVYSPFRRAFYIWHFDCDLSTDDPIQPNSIMRLDFNPTT